MISCADYYLILGKNEITPSVQAYLDILKPCAPGIVEGAGYVRINCASELDQKSHFSNIEARWEIDSKGLDYEPEEDD